MSLGFGQEDAGGDPWSWGIDENSDSQPSTDWNNGWSQQHEFKEPPPKEQGYQNVNIANQGGVFSQKSGNFNSNNNQRSGVDHQKSGRFTPGGSKYHKQRLPQNSASVFSSPPDNNNLYADVENREIAPPDFHMHQNYSQPMVNDNQDSLISKGFITNSGPPVSKQGGNFASSYFSGAPPPMPTETTFSSQIKVNEKKANSRTKTHSDNQRYQQKIQKFNPPHDESDTKYSFPPPPINFASESSVPDPEPNPPLPYSSFNQSSYEDNHNHAPSAVLGGTPSHIEPVDLRLQQSDQKRELLNENEGKESTPPRTSKNDTVAPGKTDLEQKGHVDVKGMHISSSICFGVQSEEPHSLPPMQAPPTPFEAQPTSLPPNINQPQSHEQVIYSSSQQSRGLFKEHPKQKYNSGPSSMSQGSSQHSTSPHVDSLGPVLPDSNSAPVKSDSLPPPPIVNQTSSQQSVKFPSNSVSSRSSPCLQDVSAIRQPSPGVESLNRDQPSKSPSRPVEEVMPNDIRLPSDGAVQEESPPRRGEAAGQDHTPPPLPPDNQETLTDDSLHQHMRHLSIHQALPEQAMDSGPPDRNYYLETSHLSSHVNERTPTKRHDRNKDGGSVRNEKREVPGEAELQRVVLGQMTSTPITSSTPPPVQRQNDERERGSMERMVVGERREGVNDVRSSSDDYRQGRRHRVRAAHHRDSSYEEDDHDYASDRERRRHDYRREDRHRKRRDHGSSDYVSDEEYEYDRRQFSRRDRHGRESRDYSPEYRRERDYYRDEHHRRNRGRERDYYSRNYDDEYYYRERSRPSSRSGSEYRRADYQRRDRHYYPPPGGFANREYETNKEYYEMMRRTNPMLYALWYQDYMSKLNSASVSANPSQSLDRASVHSGQSNNFNTTSAALESTAPNAETFEDYAPRLFSTAHIRGTFDGQGRLVVVDAHYPIDNQPATVQLLSADYEQDASVKEFLECPGPFIPGVTHRSTVLQYLKKMSEQALKTSEKLLYDLVYLTVKSNGNPNASDISELLVESYRGSREGMTDPWEPEHPSQVTYSQLVTRFRNLLLQGNKVEALDWAMENGGWGHALFLASKMDRRTHKNVMLQFANSLVTNDPLQTLYQLMSGHVPQASSNCGDRKWSDWRPHLAMILSNPSEKSELDRKAVITLGDSLASRGRVHAAHFCYLIAQVGFSEFASDGKLVLLGAPPGQSFDKLLSYRSVLLTLCYEYAIKQSDPTFSIPSLQTFKLVLATRLAELGRGRAALQYCELMANEVLASAQPEVYANLLPLLAELAGRLKLHDPQLALDLTAQPEWLTSLSQLCSQEEPSLLYQPSVPDKTDIQPLQVPMGEEGGGYGEQGVLSMVDPMRTSTPRRPSTTQTAPVQPEPAYQPFEEPQQQPTLFQPPPYSHQPYTGYQPADLPESSEPQRPIWKEEETQPSKPPMNFFQASENQLQSLKPPIDQQSSKEKEVKQNQPEPKKKADVAGGGTSSGWFGGIWGKLNLRPKNQMVLPDDTDPKIIFDPKLKRWVDREEEGGGGKTEMKPPPMGGPVAGAPSTNPSTVPPTSLQPNLTNKYKLQKGKSMKSNYVDVLGGGRGGTVMASSQEVEQLMPTFPQRAANPNYFIPGPGPNHDSKNDLARQQTMGSIDNQRSNMGHQPPSMPPMYNPADF